MMTSLLIGSAAALLAGMTQGSLGFGMALILSPCIMLVMQPREVVPVVLLMSILNTLIIASQSWRFARPRLLLPLIGGGIFGFTLGLRVLVALDANLIRFWVSLLVLAFTAMFWSGLRRPLPETPMVLAPVGVISGFTGGSTSISGPPVALFLTNQNTPKPVFRANLVCYFFVINCYGLAYMTAGGWFTPKVLGYSAALIPATLSGTIAGILLGDKIPEAAFQRAVLALLAVMGALLLYNSLSSLL